MAALSGLSRRICGAAARGGGGAARAGKRPLFVLLDATWTEARKMFRKSPYLDALPVLSLTPAQLSRYRLRRSTRGEHLCTAEVAAMCLNWRATCAPVRRWTIISTRSASTTWLPSGVCRRISTTPCISVCNRTAELAWQGLGPQLSQQHAAEHRAQPR